MKKLIQMVSVLLIGVGVVQAALASDSQSKVLISDSNAGISLVLHWPETLLQEQAVELQQQLEAASQGDSLRLEQYIGQHIRLQEQGEAVSWVLDRVFLDQPQTGSVWQISLHSATAVGHRGHLEMHYSALTGLPDHEVRVLRIHAGEGIKTLTLKGDQGLINLDEMTLAAD